jgi:deazaflavin-dependent oxidoreductase (nitroreductase family)
MITDMTTNENTADVHYQRPGWITKYVMNGAVRLLTRAGVGVWGARTLEVNGRKSGLPRRNPVNLLTIDGRNYLVAPRGEVEWVRNVRAADGQLTLILGSRRQHWIATEITDGRKPEILRQYLRRWKAEVGIFFGGVGAKSSDEELAAIAPRHPVFELRTQEVK